jgi:hypothetical protein
VVAHYGIDDDQVLKMPIKRFWLFSDTVDRLEASADARAIKVAASVLSNESYTKSMEALEKVIGTIVDMDSPPIVFERDAKGIQELKDMLQNF